jgi:hypothetical protein
MQRTWTTHEGERLDLELGHDEAQLFDEAKRLFDEKAGMDAIARLYLAGDSVLYRGRTGAQVVKLPIYKAIKDMAKRRGIEDGLLSPNRPGTAPALDDFEAGRAN